MRIGVRAFVVRSMTRRLHHGNAHDR
jgi:hypothetical protein